MHYLFFILLLFSGISLAQAKQTVSVYHYHIKPPLVTNLEAKQGLYYDFTHYLNTHSQNYYFETVFIPRKRLERMLLDEKFKGVLLGVNPIWFNDKKQTKYLWSETIFTDRDEIVSLASDPVEFLSPKSLIGKTFGGVRGFYYFGISELINSNQINHIETVKEVDLFYMLLNNRIDAAVISRSTFDYLIKKNSWQSRFHLSEKPHDVYDRHVLLPKNQQEVFNVINAIIKQLSQDKNWLRVLTKYR